MKTEIRKFYQMSETKLEILNLDKLIDGIDFEVVSETIFDFEANEYMSREELPKSIRETGEFIAHPDLLESDTAIFLNRQIDFRKAKMCQLGVIELLQEEHKGKQLLFPVYDMDLDVQLMAYEILTTGKVVRPFIKVLQHPEHVKYIRLVLGVTVFDEIWQLLNLDTDRI